MRHHIFLIITFALNCSNLFANPNQLKITFGSCYKQSDREKVFDDISITDPDAFFWLGDIIYADHFSPKKRRAAYNQIKNKTAYKVLENSTIIDGTWDDHDYAHNNANGDYVLKEKSKELLLEFLSIKKTSPVFKRKGIYHKRYMSKGELSVETLFLDTRSFMSKRQQQLLGPAQWSWLEDSITNSKSDLIIIASSISVLSPVSRFLFWIEGWHQFRKEKQRLLRLISSVNKKIVLISGDRHYSDASRVPLRNGNFLYEFMSSGMTKTSKPMSSDIRINMPVNIQNFSLLKINKSYQGFIRLEHEIFDFNKERIVQRNIISL